MKQNFSKLVVAATIAAVGVNLAYWTFGSLSSLSLETVSFTTTIAVISVFAALLGLLSTLRAARQHRRSLDIALIGPPGAGKTVFATVLFRELERGSLGGLLFTPYGSSTIERVRRDLTAMATGQFPPATVLGEHFFYTAVARFRRIFLDREYRIQVSDFAGEYLASLADNHKGEDSEFLDYLARSDALFMMIDCSIALRGDPGEVANLENRFIAALSYISHRLNQEKTEQIRIPVALLLSKSDIVSDSSDIEATLAATVVSNLRNLIDVCKSRCRHFKYFFVSATGTLPEGSETGAIPPPVLRPRGVLKPILWVLGSRVA